MQFVINIWNNLFSQFWLNTFINKIDQQINGYRYSQLIYGVKKSFAEQELMQVNSCGIGLMEIHNLCYSNKDKDKEKLIFTKNIRDIYLAISSVFFHCDKVWEFWMIQLLLETILLPAFHPSCGHHHVKLCNAGLSSVETDSCLHKKLLNIELSHVSCVIVFS